MICPYFRTGSFVSIRATAILCPRGTRSFAVTPDTLAPCGIGSIATTTLSCGERRMTRGVLTLWALDSIRWDTPTGSLRNCCSAKGTRKFMLQLGFGASLFSRPGYHFQKPDKTAVNREEIMGNSRLSRRSVLKTAALGSAAVITAPYVSGVYAAGTITMGCWDHWVPGANKTLDKLCKEWGGKNKVDVHIDYITSQGEKDKLTAAAEAQAGTGHDIMSHRDWNIQIHQRLLEPLDDVIAQLIKQYGPISPVAEYLAKIKGTWRGVPTAIGSQVKPCQSRFDLYKEHCDIDLVDMFPADEAKYDKAKTDKWTWDVYLDCAQKLHKAGYPVGLPMGQASDAVDWVGALFNSFGVVFVDAKDNIKINSDETRRVGKECRSRWSPYH